MLNKQKGNMYGFVTHTWNVIKGKCPHDCEYCYMKVFPQGELKFDEKELKTDLGKGNFIFVGSSCDMWAKEVPSEWIRDILDFCGRYDNTYLFQTKYPKRFEEFKDNIPQNSILCITLETNRENNLGNAPPRSARLYWFQSIEWFNKMVTIEPIMDFDDNLRAWINLLHPSSVNIGADSKNCNLPEPSSDKIKDLIIELRKFTKVNLKDNLKRLYAFDKQKGTEVSNE